MLYNQVAGDTMVAARGQDANSLRASEQDIMAENRLCGVDSL
jgi:hypothetical protein